MKRKRFYPPRPSFAAVAACAAFLWLCPPAAAQGGDAAKTAELRNLTESVAKDLKAVRRVTLKQVPPVQIVTREAYVDEYVIPSINMTWGGDFEKSLEVFKALGMIPRDLKAKPFLKKYGASMSAAAYDFLGKRILFPETAVARDTLVHELMHASQDQRYDIRKMVLSAGPDFDRMLALGALFEGEALNVQLRYAMGESRVIAGVTPYGTLREQARAQFETLRRRVMTWLPDVPPNIISAQGFVYDEGVLFVERLRRREHNWAAVDKAYLMPPRSTAQILHPEKYIAGEWPVELTIKDKEKLILDHGLVAENTLGEFGMRLFLTSHGVDAEVAAKAVDGWRGDRVFVYYNERYEVRRFRTIIWASTWESPERAKAAAEALKAAFPSKPPSGGAMVDLRGSDVTILVGDDIPAVLKVEIIRKQSTQGRPLGDQAEKAD